MISQMISRSQVSSGQAGHQQQGNQNPQNRHHRHEGRLERPGQIRLLAAQDPDSGAHNHEGQQGPDAHQFAQHADGDQGGEERHEDAYGDGRDIGRPELVVDAAGPRRQQSVARHGKENAGLAQQHHQHDGAQAEDGADQHQIFAPHDAGCFHAHSHRRGHVELRVLHDTGQQAGSDDVKHRADGERSENPHGHVLLRVLGLLGGCRDGIEPDVREEDHGRTASDARPSVLAELAGVWRNERLPVRQCLSPMAQYVNRGDRDEYQHGAHFDEDDNRVDSGRFLNADHQHSGHQADRQKCHDIEERGGVREDGHVHARRNRACRAPQAVVKHQVRAGSIDELRRQRNPQALEELNDIGAPARSHCGGTESVLQDQVPADDPREDFTQRGIAVRVRRSGDRNQRRELRIAQAGKHAADSRKDKREDDCRTGILCRGRPGEHENPRPDDRSNTERHQIGDAQHALQ